MAGRTEKAGGVTVLSARVDGALLVRASRRGELDRRCREMPVPFIPAGGILGAGRPVLTAEVLGVDIGAGLTMLFGAPMVAEPLVWALLRGAWPTNRRPAGDHRRGQQIEFAPREA
ncbi:hypothetical protein [Streptomyces prunicolor]|uniref:hypothetical protein n=1 Tax=Streptomyces prunicolor TaxID=67348 RepID=UPI001319F31D|nr:hypothetical protein [Streptomyces prunicolor]